MSKELDLEIMEAFIVKEVEAMEPAILKGKHKVSENRHLSSCTYGTKY